MGSACTSEMLSKVWLIVSIECAQTSGGGKADGASRGRRCHAEGNLTWGAPLANAAPEREGGDLESLGALDEVWQVKIADVVPDDHICVRLHYQVPPPLLARPTIIGQVAKIGCLEYCVQFWTLMRRMDSDVGRRPIND